MLWTLISIIGGGVQFGDFAGLSMLKWIIFIAGATFTIVGVYILALREATQQVRYCLIGLIGLKILHLLMVLLGKFTYTVDLMISSFFCSSFFCSSFFL